MCAKYKLKIKVALVILITIITILFVFIPSKHLQNIMLITTPSKELIVTRRTQQQSNYDGGIYSQVLYPQFKNPCFLEEYDGTIDDQTFYNKHPLVSAISKKYAKNYVQYLHRATVQTMDSNGTITTNRLRCLPYYYVLGVAKSGTTDLHHRMKCHSHVTMPVRKEDAWLNAYRFLGYSVSNYIDFFDPAAKEIAKTYGKNTLRKQIVSNDIKQTPADFKQVATIVGDHSTNTLAARHYYKPGETVHGMALPNSTAELVRALQPNARFIVILRNPIERAYSYYKMHFAVSPQHFHAGVLGAINWFNDCVAKHGYLDDCIYLGKPKTQFVNGTFGFNGYNSVMHGMYHIYVKEWLQHFPREQFLIIKSETYYSDVYGYVTNKIFPFLGLKPVGYFDKRVKHCIRDSPPAHVRSRKLRTGELDINVHYAETMLEETRQLLTDFYTPHNKELAQLMQDDSWNWW